MPFRKTRELVGFHRWVTYGYFRRVNWENWVRHRYQAHFLQNENCDCGDCVKRRTRALLEARRRRIPG